MTITTLTRNTVKALANIMEICYTTTSVNNIIILASWSGGPDLILPLRSSNLPSIRSSVDAFRLVLKISQELVNSAPVITIHRHLYTPALVSRVSRHIRPCEINTLLPKITP